MSSEMNALWYSSAEQFEVKKVPIPQYGDNDVLVKVSLCGYVCGTDMHIHHGEFNPRFPLITGHEAVGNVTAVGKNVSDFQIGDRVVADVSITCDDCFYCRRGQSLLCEDFRAKGIGEDGGFAEYVVYHKRKCYKIHNLSDEEATLLEPASCAVHGLDKLQLGVGSEVLMIGAGPTGLILSQLLKLNGASKVVLAANKGMKMDIAKKVDAADIYIELDREDPERQWQQMKKDYPYGFDAVVEATGVESLIDRSIDYVRRGGTLMVYGVYADAARVHWPPSKIFRDEIRIIGSFSQTFCFPRAVEYIDSGKINVKGMVTDIIDLKDYQDALDKMNSRQCLKIAIRP